MNKTHDYTGRGWGHDFTIQKIDKVNNILSMSGWGTGISKGDYLILPNKGETTRYQVKEIKYYNDPSDMWSMKAVYAPREIQSEANEA